MNLKLSHRERILVIFVAYTAVFFLYWTLLLNPLLVSNEKLSNDISRIENNVKNIESQRRMLTKRTSTPKKIVVYSKEDQLGLIVKFIDGRFKDLGIKLVSLHQGDLQNKLAVDINFNASYESFFRFLDSLSDLHTLYMIDSVKLVQKDKSFEIAMRISSAYK